MSNTSTKHLISVCDINSVLLQLSGSSTGPIYTCVLYVLHSTGHVYPCVLSVLRSTGLVYTCVLSVLRSTGPVHTCVLSVLRSTGLVYTCVLSVLRSTGLVYTCVLSVLRSTGPVHTCVLSVLRSTGLVYTCVLSVLRSTGPVHTCVLSVLRSTGLVYTWVLSVLRSTGPVHTCVLRSPWAARSPARGLSCASPSRPQSPAAAPRCCCPADVSQRTLAGPAVAVTTVPLDDGCCHLASALADSVVSVNKKYQSGENSKLNNIWMGQICDKIWATSMFNLIASITTVISLKHVSGTLKTCTSILCQNRECYEKILISWNGIFEFNNLGEGL